MRYRYGLLSLLTHMLLICYGIGSAKCITWKQLLGCRLLLGIGVRVVVLLVD